VQPFPESHPVTADSTESVPRFPLKSTVIHLVLFAAAFITTTFAGVAWLLKDPLELTNFPSGLTYSTLLLLMLGTHEFGHYFAARRHGVDVTLPYFLPFPSIAELSFLNPFGTLGAVIRLRSGLVSRRMLFDIGSAGPLAGFVVSFAILAWGFAELPAKEYIYTIHPEYAQMTSIPEGGWTFGSTLIYQGVAALFAPAGAFVPPMNEIYHYPFLCVGWFGLLVTAINLIPVGQLDGGHIIYAMFGTGYHRIAQTALATLALLGLAGFLPMLGIPFAYGYPGWLFWAFVLIVFSRVLKLNRPPLPDETPLDPRRRALGWLCVLIFIGSFSLVPFSFSIP
jgi:membrane-associated protease RseP (regulator of RpoE activity)